MNVLLVATVAETIEAYLTAYAKHFRALGCRVDGMANGIVASPACVDAFDRCFEASWTREPWNLAAVFRAAREVREVVRAGKYELLHFHTPIAAFVGRCAVRSLPRSRPRVIYTAHGFHFHPNGGSLKNAFYLGLEKLAAPWTDFIVVINEWDARMARRSGLSPCVGIQQLPGAGFDGARYRPEAVSDHDTSLVRRAMGLSPTQPLFLMVARDAREKRPEDALRALAACRCREAHLAFAGIERSEPSLHRLANELGIGERVHFLGFRRDVPVLMKISAATVLPSSREGLPLSVMESMSLGVPVIGSDIRGTRDLLSNGGGLLFPLGDVEGLRGAMEWVIENPSLARELGRRGKDRVAPYERRAVLQMHERLYEKALGVSIRRMTAPEHPRVEAVGVRESAPRSRGRLPDAAQVS